MNKSSYFLSAVAFGAMSVAAFAEPALIFDMGGKFDKSFNEAAFNGAEAWASASGGEYREFEIQDEAQREQAVRRFADEGANPVIATGFAYSSVLDAAAPDYPDTTFVTIDGWVEQPNVLNVGFKEHEGSYLVGMMAAMKSESGKIGFIGGMDIPLIQKFGCGYIQGARAANPDIIVLANMTGTTADAWNDPAKGGELARAQISDGADVIYHAAGGTGVGVLQAVADEGVLGIGVDSNQNGMHPGSILTSMIKRVDVAVERAMTEGAEGTLEPGVWSLGLAEDGVGYAMDENNAELVTQDMIDAVEAAKQQIISGEIVVHDFMSDNQCPAA